MILIRQDKSVAYRFLTITAVAVAIFYGCMVILQPFLPALLLGTIFCLAAWPLFLVVEQKVGGRTTLAAVVVTVLLAVCFLVPLLLLGSSLAGDAQKLFSNVVNGLQNYPAQPPARLASLPIVGPYANQLWATYAADRAHVLAAFHEYAGPASQGLLKFGASLGHGIIDVSLGIVIAFFFFRDGRRIGVFLDHIITRFAGPWGHNLLDVSKRTMIGVVYGILGTALAQAALATIGFWIAQVPGTVFLGLVTFILCVVPAGFPLVWLPVTAWLFIEGHIAAGIFMFVWGALVLFGIDLVLRPYFISLSIKLPLLLIVLGVFGGIIVFGFIGLFIGPTLLALAYALLLEVGRGPTTVAADAKLIDKVPSIS